MHLGNLHEVSRKVAAWTRQPDPALQKKASEPGFESRLETIVPNRQYRLILKPQSTDKPLRSVLAVTARGEMSDQPSSFNIYAQVR